MAVDLYAMIGAAPAASHEELSALIDAAEREGSVDQSFLRACRDVLLNNEKRAAYNQRLLDELVKQRSAAPLSAATEAKPQEAPASVSRQAEAAPQTGETVALPHLVTGRPAKFCHACGVPVDMEAVICTSCGVPQKFVQSKKPPKNKLVAALLALFFGGLGLHRFYLGNNMLGLLYLVFCWTLIPSFIGVLECIYFLTMKDDTFHRIYCE